MRRYATAFLFCILFGSGLYAQQDAIRPPAKDSADQVEVSWKQLTTIIDKRFATFQAEFEKRNIKAFNLVYDSKPEHRGIRGEFMTRNGEWHGGYSYIIAKNEMAGASVGAEVKRFDEQLAFLNKMLLEYQSRNVFATNAQVAYKPSAGAEAKREALFEVMEKLLNVTEFPDLPTFDIALNPHLSESGKEFIVVCVHRANQFHGYDEMIVVSYESDAITDNTELLALDAFKKVVAFVRAHTQVTPKIQ